MVCFLGLMKLLADHATDFLVYDPRVILVWWNDRFNTTRLAASYICVIFRATMLFNIWTGKRVVYDACNPRYRKGNLIFYDFLASKYPWCEKDLSRFWFPLECSFNIFSKPKVHTSPGPKPVFPIFEKPNRWRGLTMERLVVLQFPEVSIVDIYI